MLLIFQAMDASGKDSAIKAVLSGIDPKGCQVYSFKAPSSEELDHDFMWRTSKSLPERGRIGIFNRSYYEETLIVRVHPTILGSQKLPPEARHQAHLERALRGHQRVRALPVAERLRHPQVLPEHLPRRAAAPVPGPARSAGEELEVRDGRSQRARPVARSTWPPTRTTIRRTATPHAPWVVIPSDDKKFARTVIAAAIIDAMNGLHLNFPTLDAEQKRDLGRARRLLNQETRRAKP